MQRETGEEVYEYFDAVLDERAKSPQPDILTGFLAAEVDGERLSREEILDICYLFLSAGLDTVTDTLTCFLAFLAQHPAHRQLLVEDPTRIPAAVEELLRWETPVTGAIRVASSECELAGQRVPQGAFVLVGLGAANVDPAEFDDALEVRFDRDVNRHLAFGGGIHRCLGSHLARRELRVALREWHRRIPEYEIKPGSEVRYTAGLRCVPDLQLAWPRP